jgi:prepilin signal peptidase PulO-like enzyme (type II secretory pathway)
MNSIYEICERICPTTALLNITAVGVSLSDIEVYFKLASYGVAVIWTSIKVIQEIRHWNANKNK